MSAASVVRATHDVLATFHKSAQVELQVMCADLVPPHLYGDIIIIILNGSVSFSLQWGSRSITQYHAITHEERYGAQVAHP